MDVFDLSAKITLDSAGYAKDLSAAGKETESFGSRVTGILENVGKALAAAFAVDKVKDFFQTAVNEYAQFEQLVGGIDTLFKESSQQLQTYADAAFQTAGMSANEYMSTATSFAASLISGLGGDTSAAVELVNMAVTDMADNANKMGTDIGSIQHAYQGFAKQNYTMLDNLKLGYGGTKSEMARLINDTGILGDEIVKVATMTDPGNFEALVTLDLVIQAIHQVQDEMGITGTTALEAAGTIEGSANSMKAAWSNWLVGLADENADLSGLTQNLVTSFQTMVDNVVPVIGRIGESLITVVGEMTGIDLSPVVSAFSTAFDAISSTISNIGEAFQTDGLTGAIDAVMTSLSELTGFDLSGISSGISSIADGFAALDISPYVDAVNDTLSSLIDGVNAIAEEIDLGPLVEAFGNLFVDLVTSVEEGKQSVLESIDFQEIGEKLNDVIEGVSESINGIAEAFREGGLSGAAKELVNQIVTGFQEVGPKILETASGILEYVGQVLTQIGEYIYEMMPENVQGLIDAIGNFLGSFWEYLQELWNWLQPFVEFLGEKFVAGLKSSWEQLKIVIDGLIEAITNILNFLAAQLDIVTAAMKGDFEAAAEAVKKSWQAVVSFFRGIADSIKGIFSSLVSYMSSIGSAMWSGIKEGFANVTDWVTGVCDDIAGGFKDFFGINSPSRLFREYGQYLADGLGLGWGDEIDSVVRKMSDGLVVHGSVDFSQSSLGKSSSATINSMMSAAGTQGGVYNINLIVDGRTLAGVVFDPLNNMIKQKGVTLGA